MENATDFKPALNAQWARGMVILETFVLETEG
jgi:hypothetical protein